MMLDEAVYSDIRKRAAEQGLSVSSVVSEALSVYLAYRGAAPKATVELTKAKGGGWIGPMNPMSNRDLFESIDEDEIHGLPN